jgi:tetratricopeptide (TPR) repeat protein
VFRDARDLHLESLALRRRIGDRRGVAFTLSNLAYSEAWLGNYDRSAALLAEGVAELLDVSDGLLLGWAAVVEGVTRYLEGRFDEARGALERARRGWRDGGNRSVLASALSFIGYSAAATGNVDEARPVFTECRRVYEEIDTDWGVAGALHGLATVACLEGALDRSAQALDESVALRRRIGHRLGIAECLELESELLRARGDSAAAASAVTAAAAIRAELGTPLPRWRAAKLGADAHPAPGFAAG